MNASFNLMRRLPPKAVPKNLGAIIQLIESEDLKIKVQQKTDQPIGKSQANCIQILKPNLPKF